MADTVSFGVPAGRRESVETGATVTVVVVDGAIVEVVAAGALAATVVVVLDVLVVVVVGAEPTANATQEPSTLVLYEPSCSATTRKQ